MLKGIFWCIMTAFWFLKQLGLTSKSLTSRVVVEGSAESKHFAFRFLGGIPGILAGRDIAARFLAWILADSSARFCYSG